MQNINFTEGQGFQPGTYCLASNSLNHSTTRSTRRTNEARGTTVGGIVCDPRVFPLDLVIEWLRLLLAKRYVPGSNL